MLPESCPNIDAITAPGVKAKRRPATTLITHFSQIGQHKNNQISIATKVDKAG